MIILIPVRDFPAESTLRPFPSLLYPRLKFQLPPLLPSFPLSHPTSYVIEVDTDEVIIQTGYYCMSSFIVFLFLAPRLITNEYISQRTSSTSCERNIEEVSKHFARHISLSLPHLLLTCPYHAALSAMPLS